MLDVVMQDQFNGLDLGKALEAEQSKLQKALPVGFTFEKVIDQADVIRNAVDEFQIKFFVALLVVMVVSLLSLGWRVGIVVAAAGPAHPAPPALTVQLPVTQPSRLFAA